MACVKNDSTVELSNGAHQELLGLGLEAPVGFSTMSRQHQTFIREFLETGNPSEAARRAGYKTPNSRGAELRKNPCIRAVLEQALRISGATPERNVCRIEEAAAFWHNAQMTASSAREKRSAAGHALRYATLLASIHGKLQLKVTEDVNIKADITISTEQQKLLAESRQRYLLHVQEHATGA